MRIDGQLQLVEKVDPTKHPLISTNNITFTLDALLEREIPLPYRVVRKKVEGHEVLQLEQVTGGGEQPGRLPAESRCCRWPSSRCRARTRAPAASSR